MTDGQLWPRGGGPGPQAQGGSIGGHVSFALSNTVAEPPTGSQLRFNHATHASATLLWVKTTSIDGLDVSVGLRRLAIGDQVYIQDFDDSSRWLLFNVTGTPVDKTGYYEIPVAIEDSLGTIPAGKIELQTLLGSQASVPSGGTTGQLLAKASAANFATEWVDAYESVTFSQAGTLVAGTGTFRWYAKGAYDIIEARASVGTQPTGLAVLVDVNKNGTTIFSTQGNRPNIAVSTSTDVSGTPDVTTLADGDYLTVDIDQVGNTIAGANLVVQVVLRRS